MSENPFFDGDVGLGFLLFLTNDALRRLREKELTKYPITIRQRGTMLAIKASRGEATLASIARSRIRRLHTISNIVSRMERQGLLREKKAIRNQCPEYN